MILSCMYIATSKKKGRGVFTAENIEALNVIEIAPVIIMKPEDRKLLDKTLLHDYIFEWGPKSRGCCMALGYVPIYNHAYRSNCEYEMDYQIEVIRVKTMRFIRAGEELFLNYNGDWDNEKPVWFPVQ